MIEEDDENVWQEALKGVSPLPPSGKVAAKAPPRQKCRPERIREVPLRFFRHELKAGTAADIDRQTMRRFKREEFPVEAALDLHGFTEDKAFAAVNRFITDAYLAGKRCVIIVTGKGLSHDDEDIFAPKGVLKERVPQWLNNENLSHLILTYIHPSPRLGGSGALYILLRRRRQESGGRSF